MTKRTLGLLLIGAGIIALFSNIGNGLFGRDHDYREYEVRQAMHFQMHEDFAQPEVEFNEGMADFQAEMSDIQAEISEAVNSHWQDNAAEFHEEMANLRAEMQDAQAEMYEAQAEMHSAMPANGFADSRFEHGPRHRGAPFGLLLFPLLIGGGIFLLVRRRRMVVRRHQVQHF